MDYVKMAIEPNEAENDIEYKAAVLVRFCAIVTVDFYSSLM